MQKPDSPASIRTTGTNLERAKSHNHRVVLDVVRVRGPMSRADVARITSLSRQTIQNIIAELQVLGLIDMADKPRPGSGRGHPGVEIRFRADGGTSLGVHIDPLAMMFVLSDLGGAILWRRHVPVSYPNPAAAAALIRAAIDDLALTMPAEAAALLGVGLALPGPFNVTRLLGAHETTLPDWIAPGIDAELTRLIGLPVVVENDAKAACIGEHQFGHGREFGSFAYVYVGMGLGAGLHLNGELFRGTSRNAGELGHMVVEPNGRPCPCGNRGCLERYLSMRALFDAVEIVHPDAGSLDTALALFQAGDPRVADWLDLAADKLRLTINILDSLLDTDAIVISGQLPPPLLQALVDRLDPLLRSGASGEAAADRVRLGSFYPDATALGAAAIAVQAAISPRIDALLKQSQPAV